MKLQDMSIRIKILFVALLGPIIVAVLFAWFRISDIKSNAIDNMEQKSMAIVLMAEATRNQMARKLELGILKPFEEIDPSKIIEAVPVVSAMQTAAINAQKVGYEFRVPKVSPRNPQNTPTPFESEILARLKAEDLDEITITTEDHVKYFKAIRLTEDCMFCHGDPAGEKDPTGGIKEGWRVGEIHGAFEIISSLEATNDKIARTSGTIILWAVGILGLIFGVAWFLLQTSVIKPLEGAQDYIETIAGGDFTKECEIHGKDEFGTIITYLQKMVASLKQIINRIADSSKILRESSVDLGTDASEFTSASNELSEHAHSVATSAKEMSSNMNSVAAATEEAATNVSIVSDATRDMSATIQEISSNTTKTQEIAARAVSRAESASGQVDELGSAAEKIGKVTETITEISEQTNLLALNATIEAARAGEAGKGFAVVANEIKDLAKQTAEATFEIRSQIEGIQSTTSNTVLEIQEITKVINEINEIVVVVVAAVEEQNVTTNEIAENISQATQGLQEVTENISQSSAVADELSADIDQVSGESTAIASRCTDLTEKAESLKELSEKLESEIRKFKV